MSAKAKHASNKPKSKGLIILIVIVSILIAIAVGIIIFANVILNTRFDSDVDSRVNSQLTQISLDDPFYMVLVGTDTREEGANYEYTNGRSDTCLLARIDPVTNTVTLSSIPRDTQITLNGKKDKFNSAYSYGGITSTIEQAKKLCKVNVSHYAELSFNGMIDLVDAVGGIDIYVPEEVNDIHTQVYVPQGHQHLNGAQALSFARTRQFADGDFTRTEDQRAVIKALIEKAMNMDIDDIPGIIKAARKCLRTDLSLNDMIALANKLKDSDEITIYSSMLPSTTGSENGVSYVFVNENDLVRFMKMVDTGEDPSMLITTNGASIGSSRSTEEALKKQEEYYKKHPNSPGKDINYVAPKSSTK